MSGIAAFLPSAGGVDADACVESMLAAMAHRGPHGRFLHRLPGACLGFARLATTSERPADEGTLNPAGWSVVGDLRLDDRAAACRRLGLDPAIASDSALVAAALEAGETDAPDGLLGDFAFIGVHAPTGRLLAARDPAGIRPLYVLSTPEGLALASEARALLGLPFAPQDLDEETLADFATGMLDSHDRTFHRAVRRLPAFHLLERADPGREPEIRRYGHYRPPALAAGADLSGSLRALLREAVACRFDPAVAPAILLSGGLDSSSITVLARDVARERGWTPPLRTFSVTFDATPEATERPQIEQVLAVGGLEPTWIAKDGYDPLASLDAILAAENEPVAAPGIGLMYGVYERMAQDGFAVVLDGHAGDEVIGHGFARLGELAKAGCWRDFWDAARGASAVYGQSRLMLLLLYGTNFGSGPAWQAVRMARRTLAPWLGRGRDGAPPGDGAAAAPADLVAPALRARSSLDARLAERQAAQAGRLLDESLDHRATLDSGFQSYALEVLDKAYASVGLEPRYPYLDRRVVEFCLALPSEAKLAKGYSRLALRQAMEGLLPKGIQWRRNKFNFSGHLAEGLRRWRATELDRAIRDEAAGVGQVFAMTPLRQAFDHLLARGPATEGRALQLVWRSVVLARWLGARHSPSPAVQPVGSGQSPADTPAPTLPRETAT